jgi:hypothetical protein
MIKHTVSGTKNSVLPVTILMVTLLVIYPGCKSPAVVTDTVDDSRVEESIFAARQDTVKIQAFQEGEEIEGADAADPATFFTVQIGAFKQPMNAERAHRRAQQRFHLETSTEYDVLEELYKITVGKFLNYEQARAFCDRIVRDFPRDYNDAWVVELSQRQRRPVQSQW